MFLAGKIGAATPRPVHGPGLQMLGKSGTGHVLFGFSAAIIASVQCFKAYVRP
jgi:hypothetical protein